MVDPRGNVRMHLRIYGRVQGVFFRARMRDKALEEGVKGWVRNLPDGSVEAVVEGPWEKVLKVVCWAHHGPPLARVERVETTIEEPTGEFETFEIRY